MNGHRIQWNCHGIQWNYHRIQWNCHRIQWNYHRIQLNGHRIQRNWKQIGQIVTDFDEWSSKTEAYWSKQSPPNTILQSFLYSVKLQLISMKCHRIQWNCHRIQSNLVETITSKHYNHLQTL